MIPDPFHLQLRDFAATLAREGVTIAKRWSGRVSVRRKADRSPVTDADYAVQAAIVEQIAARYPDHAVVAEESMVTKCNDLIPANGPFCWVIDPIDGTRNFVRGLSIYATSVAVLQNGAPVAGAICDASTDWLYAATLHGGATCDEKTLLMNRPSDESDPTLLISSFHDSPIPPVIRTWMDDYHFRNYGSLALHLAWLAAGFADAAFGVDGHIWDIAAGALIVTEAGGIVTSNDGASRWPIDLHTQVRNTTPILAGTAQMHAELLQSLSDDAPG